MRWMSIVTMIAAAGVLGLGGPLLAQGALATADQIQDALIGNTVNGNLVEQRRAFTAYFGSDGTVTGKKATGTWKLQGDHMCIEIPNQHTGCYSVVLDGDEVKWYGDGELLGDGKIVPGNQVDE